MARTQHALLPGRTGRLRPAPPPAGRSAPQLPRALWYALHFPGLGNTCTDRPRAIEQLASHCRQISDHIAVVSEDALAVEIRGSLRYFGGIRRLRQTLRIPLSHQLLQWQLPAVFFDAASPSASASLLLAQTQLCRLVPSADDLRSALGGIPVARLALDTKLVRRLEQCGLLYLRDVWRLPSAALRIRFGRTLTDYLEQLLALRPAPLVRWQPAPAFCETMTPDLPAENQRDILLLASELLSRLEQFLQKHHLTADHILFRLSDDTGATQYIDLGTRRPVRDKKTWLMLLENRIKTLATNNSVSSVGLSATELQPYQPAGANPRMRGKSGAAATGSGLLETLCARLGEHAIFCLHQQQDYDPVVAGQYLEYIHHKNFPLDSSPLPPRGFGLHEQQPCLLLPSPLALRICNDQPVYLSPLTFLRGPERIETHWWSGKNIRRDYYIVVNRQGMMLWVYRDISRRCWFLQGLFA